MMQRTRVQVQIIDDTASEGAPGRGVSARFTVRYEFDEVTVIVEEIPGRWDSANEREIVSGQVAAEINRRVDAIRETARKNRQQEQGSAERAATIARTPVTIRATDFLPAA